MRHNINKRAGQYEVTSALRAGGTRKPRTRTVALSDCVCYDRDGNVIRTIARTSASPAKTRKTDKPRVTVSPAVKRDMLLQAAMGTIHDPNE